MTNLGKLKIVEEPSRLFSILLPDGVRKERTRLRCYRVERVSWEFPFRMTRVSLKRFASRAEAEKYAESWAEDILNAYANHEY